MEKSAIEWAAPPEFQQVLALPTLHIILETLPDGTMAGHCLDFDTWAFSEQKDETEARQRVVMRLLEMAFVDYIRLFQANDLSALYDNEVDDPHIWMEYRRLARNIRTNRLRTSLETLFQNPGSVSALAPAQKSTKQFDFSHFSEAEKDQLRHWLGELEDADVEKRKEILLAMVRSLAKVIPLKLAI